MYHTSSYIPLLPFNFYRHSLSYASFCYSALLLFEFEAKFLRKLIISLNERPTKLTTTHNLLQFYGWLENLSQHSNKNVIVLLYSGEKTQRECYFRIMCVCRKCIGIYDLCTYVRSMENQFH